MATNTPTFDFDREDPGADGWTDRMNSNFTDIENLLSGLQVNGENAQPFANTVNVGPDPSVSEVNTAISNASAGDRIAVQGEVIYSDTPITVTKAVTLDGYAATAKLADGTDGSAAEAAILIEETVDGAKILGWEVDGNESNQTYSAHPDSTFTHGIRIFGDDPGTGFVGASNCVVAHCNVHDTVRSGIVDEGIGSLVIGNEVRNAATDHLLYLARCRESLHIGNSLSGFFRAAAVAIATQSYAASNNHVAATSLTDVVDTPASETEPPSLSVNFRNVSEAVGNQVSGFLADATGSPAGLTLWNRQDNTQVTGYQFRGPLESTGVTSEALLLNERQQQGVRIEGSFRITANNTGGTAYGAVVESSGIELDINVDGDGAGADLRAVLVSGANRTIDRLSLTLTADVGSDPIRAVGDTNSITFSRLDYAADTGSINTSGTVTFEYVDRADGTISSTAI